MLFRLQTQLCLACGSAHTFVNSDTFLALLCTQIDGLHPPSTQANLILANKTDLFNLKITHHWHYGLLMKLGCLCSRKAFFFFLIGATWLTKKKKKQIKGAVDAWLVVFTRALELSKADKFCWQINEDISVQVLHIVHLHILLIL